MTLKEKLNDLDALVSQGKIIEAFEQFFADQVSTRGESGIQTESKEEKLGLLRQFFTDVPETVSVELHKSSVQDNVSFSKFTFLFKNKDGDALKWHEVIQRTWDDNGLVIDELYSSQSISDLKKALKKEAKEKALQEKEEQKKQLAESKADSPAKEKSKKEKPAKAKKKEATSKKKKSEKEQSETPTAEKKTKPAAKAKKVAEIETPVTPDNLKLIEGIGPKIEFFLKEDGIDTFAKLATSKPEEIRQMLVNKGGTRYNANDPSTWPEQAALAAKGQLEELKALQSELKGGRRS
ncbi:hypothetical protein LAG90_01120 [Marinilongibacter aquaticus]|uniref:hypothetical protein n=1 Tax=Marinilongibacter aquaticus TaxID=2975157 RepID=UPI0021BDE6A0|nr:hypothetical protein [Marinilongibacter aquaticus]UBM59258.1 hypothetical protein LAG90_01120 [Marinilongibacter aquaticus]